MGCQPQGSTPPHPASRYTLATSHTYHTAAHDDAPPDQTALLSGSLTSPQQRYSGQQQSAAASHPIQPAPYSREGAGGYHTTHTEQPQFQLYRDPSTQQRRQQQFAHRPREPDVSHHPAQPLGQTRRTERDPGHPHSQSQAYSWPAVTSSTGSSHYHSHTVTSSTGSSHYHSHTVTSTTHLPHTVTSTQPLQTYSLPARTQAPLHYQSESQHLLRPAETRSQGPHTSPQVCRHRPQGPAYSEDPRDKARGPASQSLDVAYLHPPPSLTFTQTEASRYHHHHTERPVSPHHQAESREGRRSPYPPSNHYPQGEGSLTVPYQQQQPPPVQLSPTSTRSTAMLDKKPTLQVTAVTFVISNTCHVCWHCIITLHYCVVWLTKGVVGWGCSGMGK
jgi:hypothetical protein